MKNLGIMLKQDSFDLDIKVIRDAGGKIARGFQIGDVTKQNTAVILLMNPGELKERPTVGVGINNMILDKDYLLYKHKIRQQLTADGMQVNYLEISNQNIEINANYK